MIEPRILTASRNLSKFGSVGWVGSGLGCGVGAGSCSWSFWVFSLSVLLLFEIPLASPIMTFFSSLSSEMKY